MSWNYRTGKTVWLNGLWSPLGIETFQTSLSLDLVLRLNGLWSPLGIETIRIARMNYAVIG